MLENLNIGVDIEEISRFEKYKTEKTTILAKIFSESEIQYCLSKNKPSQHFAARFSAKEAVIKVLSGFGIKNIFPKDIEIYHDQNNVPQISLLKEGIDFSFKVSLSHSSNQAVAFVIGTKNE